MKLRRLLCLLVTACMMLTLLCACADPEPPKHPSEDTPDTPSDPSPDDPSTDVPSDPSTDVPSTDAPSTDAPSEPDAADKATFVADLDRDDVDDRVYLAYDESAKSVTLSIVSGKDDTELMSETVKTEQGERVAYCLKLGKGQNRDELVRWTYRVTPISTLILQCHVFHLNAKGEIVDIEKRGQTFTLSADPAMLAHQEPSFVSIRETINANIVPNAGYYDSYLLLDCCDGAVRYSTADEPLLPQEITFGLSDLGQ